LEKWKNGSGTCRQLIIVTGANLQSSGYQGSAVKHSSILSY